MKMIDDLNANTTCSLLPLVCSHFDRMRIPALHPFGLYTAADICRSKNKQVPSAFSLVRSHEQLRKHLAEDTTSLRDTLTTSATDINFVNRCHGKYHRSSWLMANISNTAHWLIVAGRATVKLKNRNQRGYSCFQMSQNESTRPLSFKIFFKNRNFSAFLESIKNRWISDVFDFFGLLKAKLRGLKNRSHFNNSYFLASSRGCFDLHLWQSWPHHHATSNFVSALLF